MKFLRSIRWRLQLWYGLLLVAVLAGFGFTAWKLARDGAWQQTDEELRRLGAIVDDATRPPVGRPRPGPDDPSLPLHFRRGEEDNFNKTDGTYYVVWRQKDGALQRSDSAPADVPKPANVDNGARTRGEWREIFLHSNKGDLIVIGRSATTQLAALHKTAWKLAGAATGILALALFGGWWFVKRALRPIHEISVTATKISSGDLSQRINVATTEDELGELAGLLNSTFARLDEAFAQQARFTADAAHELRTPVTVMLTHAQSALETSCDSDEHREAFAACQRAAQRMRRLIESLLELARFDAGQVKLHQKPFDLSQVVEECVELVQPLAAARCIRIETELQNVECAGDPDRLGQVVLNLLTNAIHYNNQGGAVRVQMHAEARSAFLTIADNGPGISAEHLPHIFERFYRADKARTTSTGRTGLGLAISKAIVTAHHGKISVESTSGKGATFTVELPIT